MEDQVKIKFHHYRFAAGYRETHVGVNYSREVFNNHHQKITYDLSVNYGKGCVYVEMVRKL
jgi:hypothetical protein